MENGNIVQIGDREEDNFIQNRETNSKIMLTPTGKGSYVMEMSFQGGGKTQITVDSGAEENVCPWEWGEQFGMQKAHKWMNFRDASGNRIEHYGKRNVFVNSTF